MVLIKISNNQSKCVWINLPNVIDFVLQLCDWLLYDIWYYVVLDVSNIFQISQFVSHFLWHSDRKESIPVLWSQKKHSTIRDIYWSVKENTKNRPNFVLYCLFLPSITVYRTAFWKFDDVSIMKACPRATKQLKSIKFLSWGHRYRTIFNYIRIAKVCDCLAGFVKHSQITIDCVVNRAGGLVLLIDNIWK